MITYQLAILLGIISIIFYVLISVFLKVNPKKIIISCIFIVYLTAVAVITLFPILIDEKVEYFGNSTWYNIIPFKTITQTLQYGISTTAIVQIFGNIFMSVPFGVFVMLFLRNPKWWKMLLFALLLTVGIELSQMIIGLAINNMYRTVDIDDIILNVIGTYLGYGIYKILPLKVRQQFYA